MTAAVNRHQVQFLIVHGAAELLLAPEIALRSLDGDTVARGAYVNRLGRLLAHRPSRLADARRFAIHLAAEYEAVFSFLFDPTLDATNWRAEHALRPAVVTRKVCGGGNRTVRGAQTQQVLASGLRTAPQRRLNTTETPHAALAGAETSRPRRLSVSSDTLTR